MKTTVCVYEETTDMFISYVPPVNGKRFRSVPFYLSIGVGTVVRYIK
jgi:hypothetical protein